MIQPVIVGGDVPIAEYHGIERLRRDLQFPRSLNAIHVDGLNILPMDDYVQHVVKDSKLSSRIHIGLSVQTAYRRMAEKRKKKFLNTSLTKHRIYDSVYDMDNTKELTDREKLMIIWTAAGCQFKRCSDLTVKLDTRTFRFDHQGFLTRVDEEGA